MKTGMIKTKHATHIFRKHDDKILLHDIKSELCRGSTQKCDDMPKGEIHIFDIDEPPTTVPYQPILALFT